MYYFIFDIWNLSNFVIGEHHASIIVMNSLNEISYVSAMEEKLKMQIVRI
jgi:hypothetical protein